MKILLNILNFRTKNFCVSKSFTSIEKDFPHLANIEEENQHFNIERYIFCQMEKTCRLRSTASGREKIIIVCILQVWIKSSCVMLKTNVINTIP